MTADCYPGCREDEFDQLPPRERIAYDSHWRVVHATGSSLLGWLVLLPRRHVPEVADLSADEANSLGSWQVRLAQALNAELGTAKTYVVELGEQPGFHLHFHVVPRSLQLAPELLGPKIFGLLGNDVDDEVSPVARDAFRDPHLGADRLIPTPQRRPLLPGATSTNYVCRNLLAPLTLPRTAAAAKVTAVTAGSATSHARVRRPALA